MDSIRQDEFLQSLVNEYQDLDKAVYTDRFSSRSFNKYIKLSSIIKKKMNEQDIQDLAFVFPNSQNLVNEFTIFEVFRAILNDEIHADYDLSSFQIGDRVSIGKATVIYKGVKEENKKKSIIVECSDCNSQLPIAQAPMFQKTNSKQLSGVQKYNHERKLLLSKSLLTAIANTKSHMDKTIVLVNLDSSIQDIMSSFSEISLDGKPVKDLVFISKLVNGKQENAFSSKDKGISPLLIATEIPDFNSAGITGKIHSIILNYSKRLEDDVITVQKLRGLHIPVTILIDKKDYLESRLLNNFKTWVWDKENINQQGMPINTEGYYPFLFNCMKHKIEYLLAESPVIEESFLLITESFRQLNKEGKVSDRFPFVSKIYQAVLNTVRCPFSFNSEFSLPITTEFSSLITSIENDKNYLPRGIYESLITIVNNLQTIHSADFSYPKGELLIHFVTKIQKDNPGEKVFIVLPDTFSKNEFQLMCNQANPFVVVLYVSDYLSKEPSSGKCIITGWLSKKQMREVLYSYKSSEYYILLYNEEKKRWAEPTSRTWNRTIQTTRNSIITKILGVIPDNPQEEITCDNADENLSDEESIFHGIVMQTKLHQYYGCSGNRDVNNPTVDASIIEFEGSKFMFVTDKHKMLVVSDSFTRVRLETSSNLLEGSFVVIRKSSKDIIREEADRILKKERHDSLRSISSEWKEALYNSYCECNYSIPQLHELLSKNGCNVGMQAVRVWVTDPEMIIMQEYSDLTSIINSSSITTKHSAKVIYSAGRAVRTSHQEAGRNLSEKMTVILRDSKSLLDVSSNGSIDIDIPDVGEVSLFRVVSVSKEKETVEVKDLNRLLS